MATENPSLPADVAVPRPLAKKRLKPADALFFGGVLAALLIALGFLAWLLVSILIKGLPALDWDFLTQKTSSNPETAGFNSSIRVTFVLMLITFAIAIPIGFAAALYLEKFAAISRAQLLSVARTRERRLADLRARGAAGPRILMSAGLGGALALLGAGRADRQPDHRRQHLEPRGGAVDHLRPARPGRLRRRSSGSRRTRWPAR